MIKSEKGDSLRKNHFAVVTVVRNDLTGLKKSRASLESQTYKNWIHIIVDGGSKDGTLKYLKSLPAENTLYLSESDNGIYDAMNKAWKLAAPESYVFYLNARDTFVGKKSLSEANRALSLAGNPLWGCTTHEEIEENGDGWVCKLVSPPSVANQLYAFGYRSHQAVVMKTKLIETLGGFNEIYKIAADWDLIVKAIQASPPAIWKQSLARFELGGMSSGRLLEAHLELRSLRRIYLKQNTFVRQLDEFWCAIFLSDFGYRNSYSRIIQTVFNNSIIKNQRRHQKNRGFKTDLIFHFGNFRFEFRVLQQESLSQKRSVLKKVVWKTRQNLILILQNKLSISPYS